MPMYAKKKNKKKSLQSTNKQERDVKQDETAEKDQNINYYEYEEKNAIGKREELNESTYGSNNGNNNNLKTLCKKKKNRGKWDAEALLKLRIECVS